MMGGGPFRLQPGQWTDDTSMALCLAESLIVCRGFNARDQMERYCRWWLKGHLSSTGSCFDIGRTTATALLAFTQTGNPFAGSQVATMAGNGAIMRLAPVPMYFHSDISAAERYAAESSKTTHAAGECVDASRLFARILVRALRGAAKEDALLGDRKSFSGAPSIVAIADGVYLEKTERDIRGSGYVVESLEAALWCFSRTASFREAVLMAANLGDDADTTAAVAGQLAGAFYGEGGIASAWLERLAMRDEIRRFADQLRTLAPAN